MSFMPHPQKGIFITVHISNSTLLASPLDSKHTSVQYFSLCEFYVQGQHEAPKENAQYFEVYNWLFRASQTR